MQAQDLINIFKKENPELNERIQFCVIHDSIQIACSPDDELEVMEKVAELNERFLNPQKRRNHEIQA